MLFTKTEDEADLAHESQFANPWSKIIFRSRLEGSINPVIFRETEVQRGQQLTPRSKSELMAPYTDFFDRSKRWMTKQVEPCLKGPSEG